MLKALIDDFLPWIPKHLPNHTVTLIQFSGIGQLEAAYQPGSFGKTQIEGCNMYNIELATCCLDKNFPFDDVLDGPGLVQIWTIDLRASISGSQIRNNMIPSY